jgi:hypothetical protein
MNKPRRRYDAGWTTVGVIWNGPDEKKARVGCANFEFRGAFLSGYRELLRRGGTRSDA